MRAAHCDVAFASVWPHIFLSHLSCTLDAGRMRALNWMRALKRCWGYFLSKRTIYPSLWLCPSFCLFSPKSGSTKSLTSLLPYHTCSRPPVKGILFPILVVRDFFILYPFCLLGGGLPKSTPMISILLLICKKWLKFLIPIVFYKVGSDH